MGINERAAPRDASGDLTRHRSCRDRFRDSSAVGFV